jgi:CheY-like chemotaxis protein
MASERREVIAVVDDDLLMREALHGLLSSLGYRTELYASGAEFLAAAQTTKASCLLLDVQLGAMTGIELARHLRSTGFSVPTIFMTGSKDESYQRDGVSLRCVDYLHKPFPASRLTAAIDKALVSPSRRSFLSGCSPLGLKGADPPHPLLVLAAGRARRYRPIRPQRSPMSVVAPIADIQSQRSEMTLSARSRHGCGSIDHLVGAGSPD